MTRSLLLAFAALLLPAPTLAQQPTPSRVDVTGTVIDSVTSGRVPGAVVSLDGRQMTLTDSTGAFTLRDVPVGPGVLVVRSLGYLDARVPVTVGDPAPPLLLRLSPDPLALEAIDVLAGRGSRVMLGGIVTDAVTGARLPAAIVTLPYQSRRSRTLTDADGAFGMKDVTIGPNLVLVEQIGYHPALVPVLVTPSPAPLEIPLSPDPILLEGIGVMSHRFSSRRRSIGIASRSLDIEPLALSPWSDLRQLLQNQNFLTVVPCRDGSVQCVIGRRGAASTPEIYIDELPAVDGLNQLATYQPSELYLLEVYGRGRYIRIYTRAFVERTGRRPQALLPICWFC